MADNSNGAEPVYGNGYPTESAPAHATPVYTADHPEQASHDPRAQTGPVPPLATDAPAPPYTAPYPPYPSEPVPVFGIAPNVAAGRAYFTIIPALIFLLNEPYRSHPLVRFHSLQSIFFFLAVAVVKAVLGILGAVFPALLVILLSSIISLILLAGWLVAMLQAFRGERSALPLIGPLAGKSAA